MNRSNDVMLKALRSALRGSRLADDLQLPPEDWETVLKQAGEQEILPLVYEAVYPCQSFRSLARETRSKYQRGAQGAAIRQGHAPCRAVFPLFRRWQA